MEKLSRTSVAAFADLPLEAVEPITLRVQLRDGRMATARFRIRGDTDAILVTEVDGPAGAEPEVCWVEESVVLVPTA